MKHVHGNEKEEKRKSERGKAFNIWLHELGGDEH